MERMNKNSYLTKIFASIIALSFILGVSAQFATAQEDNASDRPTVEQRRAALQATIDERRAAAEERRGDIETQREERKEALDEKRKERIQNHVTRIVERMEKAINRLRTIADRVESRIDKLEGKFADRGLDLSESRGLLLLVRAEIDVAEGLISDIEDISDEALSSDTPREAFDEARIAFSAAKDSIKTIHSLLKDTVKTIKVSLGPVDGNVTATDNDSSDDDDNATTTDE